MSVLDTVIARLAARQHGVVALWQLTALGVSTSGISRRVADGRLRRVHQGVYAVGPLDRRGYWMAAVLACGERALLSHRDAAMLWSLRRTSRTAVDVTAPGTRRRRRPRITVHGSTELHPDDRAEVDGIPVTSVPRTLLDLAEVVPAEHLRRAYEAAERRELLDMRAVHELIARSNGRRGLSALLALLDYDPREAIESKSDLESRFLDLVRDAGLPIPQLNVLVEGFLVRRALAVRATCRGAPELGAPRASRGIRARQLQAGPASGGRFHGASIHRPSAALRARLGGRVVEGEN
jgi:hypothetical protein